MDLSLSSYRIISRINKPSEQQGKQQGESFQEVQRGLSLVFIKVHMGLDLRFSWPILLCEALRGIFG